MAEPKTKNKDKVARNNTVHIVGYLAEDNLEVVTKPDGSRAIRGSLVIATSDVNRHKVQFYANEFNTNHEENKDFKALEALLPQNVISIASYLKSTTGASFETAANASAKVWVMARFEEFASRVGEIEKSMILLKGFRAGFKQATDSSPFDPRATFKVDVYINALTPDTDENGEETGKLRVEGLVPVYDDSVYKITFVAYADDNAAKYVSENYAVKDTVTLEGDLTSLVVKKENTNEGGWGRASAPQYETRFVRERRIVGGSKKPLEGESAITTAFIKNALVLRDTKMAENGKKSQNRNNAAKATNEVVKEAAPAQTTAKDSVNVDEVDF